MTDRHIKRLLFGDNQKQPCGRYLHIPDCQRYVTFPSIPTYLDRDRVDNWYMKTLEVLGIWPAVPEHHFQCKTTPRVCNMNGCKTSCRQRDCGSHYHHDHGCRHVGCYSYYTTPKAERIYFFVCNNHKCKVNTFTVRERLLDLVAVNPSNFEDRMYMTKCKCGMTCASTQVVDTECVMENDNYPVGYCAPRFRRERKRLLQQCTCNNCSTLTKSDDLDPEDTEGDDLNDNK